jgi:hypothetical protein
LDWLEDELEQLRRDYRELVERRRDLDEHKRFLSARVSSFWASIAE